MKTFFKSEKKIFYLALIIFFGSFLRGYNINFDDFWSDEMVSFYLSNPHIGFIDSINLIFKINLTVTFEIILKYFHLIFGYDIYVSRYLNLFLSTLSILYFYKLTKNNSNNKVAILGILLLSLNIFHIRYAVEVRSYTLSFLMVTIFLNLIFKKGFIREKINLIRSLKICLVSILMLFSHAFTILVPLSLNTFIFLKYIYQKNFTKGELLIFTTNIVTTVIFLFVYIQNITHTPSWIPQLKSSFYTNYFFSNFFGSRLIGGIYLIVLIYLFSTFIKKIIKEMNINFFFLILIFLTYSITIIYGYLVEPILIPRYIIFVLIPVLFLISNFVFNIKSKILRFTILLILVLPTFLNHFTENTFKQLYTKIYPSKPEIKKVFLYMEETSLLNYSFFINVDDDNHLLPIYNDPYKNYLEKYSIKISQNFKFINYKDKQNLPENFWLIYITDVTDKPFIKPQQLKKYDVNDMKSFNHIEIYKLKKNET